MMFGKNLRAYPAHYLLGNWVSLWDCQINSECPKEKVFYMPVDGLNGIVKCDQGQDFLQIAVGLQPVQKTLKNFDNRILRGSNPLKVLRDVSRGAKRLRPYAGLI